jgi:ParB family chromosome partitioning protein
MNIPLEEVHPNPNQPRKHFDEEALQELADSIKVHGVLMPILVRPEDGKYVIVAGERRWRASKMAGLKEIPCTVSLKDDRELFEASIVENVQRKDLSPLEEATAYKQLLDMLGSVVAVAERVGKARATVSNMLRLFKLPESGLVSLREGKMGVAQALTILSAPPHLQDGLVNLVNEKNLQPSALRNIFKPTDGAYENYRPEVPKTVDMVAAEVEVVKRINGKRTQFTAAVCPECAFEFEVDS